MTEKIYNRALEQQIQEADAIQAKPANIRASSKELIKELAKEILSIIKGGLLREGRVRIHNFGTFRLKMAKQRYGYNPHTRERILIPARPRVIFTPAKALKEEVDPHAEPVRPVASITQDSTQPTPPETSQPITVIHPVSTDNVDIQPTPETVEQDQYDADIDTFMVSKTMHASSVLRNKHRSHLGHTSQQTYSSNTETVTENITILGRGDSFTDNPSDSIDSEDQVLITPETIEPVEETPKAIISDFDTSELESLTDNTAIKSNTPTTLDRDEPINDETETNPEQTNKPKILINDFEPLEIEPAKIDERKNYPIIPISITAILLLLLLVFFFWSPSPEISENSQIVSINESSEINITKESNINVETNTLETTPIEPEIITLKPEEPVIETAEEIAAYNTDTDITDTEIADSNTEELATIAEPIISEPAKFSEPDVLIPATPPVFFVETRYQITVGDNLWKLANRFYVNPFIWPHIYRENYDLMPNPDLLEVNDVITLPTLEGHPTDLTKTDKYSIAEGYFLMYLHYKKTGYKNAHYALLGAKWFDPEILVKYKDQIEIPHQQKLEAKRADNALITAALKRNAEG